MGMQDLIPFNKRTETEQKEIARQGGIASGKARRQKKTLREIGDMIGSLDIQTLKNREVMLKAGLKDEDLIRDVEMMFRLSLKASQGDVRAIELLAKLRGQLKEQVEQTNIEMPAPRLARDRSEKN